MEEKKTLTEYQIKTLVSDVSYLDSSQRQLVIAALEIHQKKHGGFKMDETKELLRDLHSAGLISSGPIESILKRLFI